MPVPQGESRGHVTGARVAPSQEVLDLYDQLNRIRVLLNQIAESFASLSTKEMTIRAEYEATLVEAELYEPEGHFTKEN